MKLYRQTALSLSQLIKQKAVSIQEVLDETFDRIENSKLNAYTVLCREEARTEAEKLQKKILSGEETGALVGVPMGIKANISTKDVETSCCSKMLEGYRPVFDATAVKRLRKTDALLLGKCTMDEFAMGGSTETAANGPAKNPWDLGRVPGGSSGGSAAAVAGGEAFFALGSDTGGSIRQPCAFCGLTGIKPTYGAVSRYGLIAYASSLDQIGPMGKDIRDCYAVLSAIGGQDPRDATSRAFSLSSAFPEGGVKGMKLGMPHEYFTKGLSPDVKTVLEKAAQTYEALGAEVIPFSFLPEEMMDYTIAAYYIIACGEASANLARYDGVAYGYRAQLHEEAPLEALYVKTRSEGFGLEAKRRIMLGTHVLSAGFYEAYYQKAQQARACLVEAWRQAFTRFDALLTPVAPTTAYALGENIGDPVKMMMGDMYTVAVNMAGLPAVALPAGFSEENGMPVGMQLVGKAFSEALLVRAADAFQQAKDYHRRCPDEV